MKSDVPVAAFRPAWWLPGGHAQTLWRRFGPVQPVAQRRERIELQDGDFIDLDWCADAGHGTAVGAVVVFILHGLCGCSTSSYVRSLQAVLGGRGISSVAMNFRGCSGEVNRLATAWHSGVSADVNEVFNALVEKYPGRSFMPVGYSLGANVLLKWLAEIGSHPAIARAVAVSTPFSLEVCSRSMLRGMGRFYGWHFVRRLSAALAHKHSHLQRIGADDEVERLSALGDLRRIRTLWEFDERVTAPLHGFRGAQDYYTRCSSNRFLNAVSTDTLLIQSRDDPLIPAEVVPRPATLPGNVELRLSDRGGHVGFCAGWSDNWLERQILSFVPAPGGC